MYNRKVFVFCFRSISRKLLVASLVLCLSVIPTLSKDKLDAAPPGNWGAIESMNKDTSVSVRMTSGDRMDGKFLKIDADAIYIGVDRQVKILPRRVVAEIWQHRAPDKKLNGILIGMGTGALSGVVVGKAINAEFQGEDAFGILLVAAGLGFGALIGGVTDAAIKSDKLLYRK